MEPYEVLFDRWQTTGKELLAHKYRYYVLDNPILGDEQYDLMEKEWIELGKFIGRTRTPPNWVGFDKEHPWAAEVIADIEKGNKV